MRHPIHARSAELRQLSAPTDGRFQTERRVKEVLIAVLISVAGVSAAAAETDRPESEFRNIADSTTGFATFGVMPAISESGAVAFIASGTNFGQGVFRWHDGRIETIASRTGDGLSGFGDDVVINCANRVAFDANQPTGRAIFTSDGHARTTIADSAQQSLVGGPFLGLGAMNCGGVVAFSALRVGFKSQAIFAGSGGPLQVLVDTASSDFTAIGNVAINAAGQVVFRAFRNDGSVGLFTGPGGSIDVADNNNPEFSDFLDPVIDRAGVVASAAFLSNGETEVFTGTGTQLTARTDPAGPITFIDNVAISDNGTLTFFADDSSGGQAIYIEGRGQNHPAALIRSGDPLFGSVVTGLNTGRFSVNDRKEVVFQYSLQDGRSGIAVGRVEE